MSGTGTSTQPAPAASAPAGGADRPARAYDRIVRSSEHYREQLRTTVRRMGLTGREGTLLVLGCGSGAPVQGVYDEVPGWAVIAADGSAELVGQANRQNWPRDYRFVHATAQNLDRVFAEERIPGGDLAGILVVFQMRHVPADRRDRVLDDLYARLRPGAPIAIHEYSVRGVQGRTLRWAAACFLDYLPRIRLKGRTPGVTDFLWRSVRRFDATGAFVDRMEKAGFTDVRVQTFAGWQEHILYTFLGRRPVDDGADDVVLGPWAGSGTDGPSGAGPEEAVDLDAPGPTGSDPASDLGVPDPGVAHLDLSGNDAFDLDEDDGIELTDPADDLLTHHGPVDTEAETPPHGLSVVDPEPESWSEAETRSEPEAPSGSSSEESGAWLTRRERNRGSEPDDPPRPSPRPR